MNFSTYSTNGHTGSYSLFVVLDFITKGILTLKKIVKQVNRKRKFKEHVLKKFVKNISPNFSNDSLYLDVNIRDNWFMCKMINISNRFLRRDIFFQEETTKYFFINLDTKQIM